MTNITFTLLTDGIVRQVWKKIEANINNPDLDIKILLRFTAVSRSSLHRKVFSQTGMSVTALIRHIRLSRSCELLLEEPRLTISEVAYAVGFSSISYYSRRFKELYGISPQVYRERFSVIKYQSGTYIQ